MRHVISALRARVVQLRTLPRTAKAGAVVIAMGLVLDAWVHSLGVVIAGSVAATIAQQHLAHLVVLVGMVWTLAGIVADGVRQSRHVRQERRPSHAIR